MVTASLSAYDGGKLMFGFGGIGGIMQAGWAMKMWGALGTTNCGDNAKITGYVTMVPGTDGDLAATANCVLTAAARTQWTWSSMTAELATGSVYNNSVVILHGGEESICGTLKGSCDANNKPWYYAVGGTTGTSSSTW